MEKHAQALLNLPYETLNELSPRTKNIWIVFHGYGMLSRYFIRKFSILDPEENYVIAPQGLSKFYLEGFSGRVGATWMTKEDRLTEIDNQKAYIDAVLRSEGVDDTKYNLIFFGFSQGVATVSRYLVRTDWKFDKLVLWAGSFPPEIERKDTSHWSDKLQIQYFTGTNDQFLKPGMIDNMVEVVEQATGIEPEVITFEGKHEVVSELLYKV
jgi:predicted esterase